MSTAFVACDMAPAWQEEKECILQDMNRVYAFCAFAFSCFIAQLSFVLKKMPGLRRWMMMDVSFGWPKPSQIPDLKCVGLLLFAMCKLHRQDTT